MEFDISDNFSKKLIGEYQLLQINRKDDKDKPIYTTKIETIFYENIFKRFVSYCIESNIKTLGDLNKFDFKNLDKVKGIGVGKKEKILERYEKIINYVVANDSLNSYDYEDYLKGQVELDICSVYLNKDVEVLLVLGNINEKTIEDLRRLQLNTIRTLTWYIDGSSVNIPHIANEKLSRIYKTLKLLEMDLSELINEILTKLKNNSDYKILIQRAINKSTLLEIGQSYGVTKERIRQREMKITSSIIYISQLIIDKSEYTENSLIDIRKILEGLELNNEDIEIIIYSLKVSEKSFLEYCDEVNKFVLKGSLNNHKQYLSNFRAALPEVINIKEELEYIVPEELKKFSIDEIVDLVLKFGLYEKCGYLIAGSLSKTKIYNYIVKFYFRNGINFSDENNIKSFNAILVNQFNFVEDTQKNIKSKVEERCILYNRSTYIHPDNIQINTDILREVKEYIDESEENTLYLNCIFETFKSKLNNNNITNRHYLQGLLKYCYTDIYKFTRDTVYKGDKRYDRNYILTKYLKEKKEVATKAILEEKFIGWTPIMFTMASEECSYILKWGNGDMVHMENVGLATEAITRFENELEECFKGSSEVITGKDVFDRLIKKGKLYTTSIPIDTSYKLFSVLESLFNEKFYFKRPYILNEKPEHNVSALKIIKELFSKYEYITLKEIVDFCNSKMLTESTRFASVNKLLMDTIEVEKGKYVLRENFQISNFQISKIKEKLMSAIDESEYKYISINAIEDFTKFPKMNYNWNKYLLKDITSKYISEIRVLKRRVNDKRNNLPILVRENSEIKDLCQLITHVLYSEFKDRETISLSEFSKYLKEKDIINDGIPMELYNSKEIFIEDCTVYKRK